MLMKFIILISLFIVSASAYTLDTSSSSVYRKDFGIFVYGDIESIENAFILIQAVSTSSKLQTIIALFMLFFLPYTFYKMSSTGTFKPLFTNLTYVTASVLTMSTATVPSASIHIEDLRTETIYAGLPAQTYAKIDNIPYPIALVTSTVSTITDSLMILYEDATALLKPDLVGASSTAIGSGNAINDIIKILQFSSYDKSNDEATNLFVRSFTAYVEQCGLKQALNVNPDLVVNFKNPSKDLFKSIDPSSLGITGSSYTLSFIDATNGEKSYQCDVFWNNNVISQYSTVASKLKDRLSKVLTGNLDSPDVVHSYLTLGGTINDTVISGEIGKMDAFIINAASRAPLSKAFANTAIDMSSGQDLANRITAGASLAEMQMQGAGQMKWVSEVLPFGYHYMLGIIYSISMLVMIVATAFGYEKGFVIWKNFTKGLTTYEFIKISLVIVNSSVNQYTAKHAADFIASLGANPATVDSIPYYYNYMATMSGVAGTLGVIAILSIPAMVFSGEVSMAMSALGSLAGKYKGNDTRTAQEVTAEQKAKQEAYERELQDQAMLDRLGISAPAGMGASEFYSMYKKGAEVANSSWGAQRMGTNALADAGVAVKGQTMQGISAGATLGTHTAMSEFVSSGISGGLRHSGGIKGEGNALADFGEDAIELSAKVGAYTQGAEGVMMTEGRVNAGLANGSDGRLTSKALKSMSRRAGFDSANLAAMADAKFTDKHGSSLSDEEAFALRGKAASGQASETPIKDAAYINTAMDFNGGLNQKYASGLGTSEEAKLASVKGVGALSSADQERYVKASENASTIKAAQTIGDTEGQMKQYGDEAKKAGKELADVIRDVANTVAQGKTGSTIGSINQVGSEAYIQNQITKAQSDTESLDRTIKRAGTPDNYINTNARQAAGQFGAMMDTMSEADKKYAGQGGYEGMLSINAIKQVDDGYAAYKGETSGANPKRNMDGTLTSAGENAISFASAQKAGEEIRRAENFNDQNTMNAIVANMINKGKTEQERRDIAQDMYSKNAIQWARFDEKGNLTDVMANVGEDAAAAMGAMEGEKLTSKMGGAWANGKQFQVATGGKSAPTISSKRDTSDTEDNSENYKSGDYRSTGHKMKAAKTFARTVLGNDANETDVETLASKIHDSSEMANFLTSKEGLSQSAIASLKAAGDATGQSDKVDAFINGLGNEKGFTNGEATAGALTLTALTGYGADRATKALTGKSLWDRTKDSLSGQDAETDKQPMNGSTKNNNDNPSGNPKQDSKHGNSFHDDIKNYTEEYGASKELFDKESRNLDDLKGQRGRIDDDHPRAHKLDEQIAESEKKMASHQHDMEIANRNVKATKHLASQDIHANTSHSKWGFLSKMATSVAASVGIANAGEFGETLENTMNTIDPFSNFVVGQPLGAGSDDTMRGIRGIKGGTPLPSNIPIMTLNAAQNDAGLAPAIDAFNTQQNISALQKIQPNTIATMQTRGGEMSFMNNSKTGNLNVHLPGQAFAENTGIPFSQFQDYMSNPAQAQQFAQLIAKSNYDGQSGGGVASATDMEMLKNEMNTNFRGISTAASKVVDSYNNNMTSNDERFQALQAQHTVAAAQNDPGLAPAIDAYNTQQNISALQKMQPNTIATMQTRGGEMSFMNNSKTGNLNVHLPGQAFAENTGIPFSQFQDYMSNPAQAQQFAQLIAKSNYDGQSGGGVASATDMEQLKNEIDRNFQQNSIQTMNLRTSASMTAMDLHATNRVNEQHNIKEQPQDTNQEAMIDKKTLDDNKPLDTNTPHNTPIKPSMDLHATNGVSAWQKDTFLQNTLNAAQNDSELAPAIDSYNASQNSLAMQQVQPNRITTMQTRGGEMSFVRNSKSGNLDVHLPSQPFAENTNIPFGQFQDIASNPQMAQQFAQMVAKSNFDGQSGGGIASATDMEMLKNEMNTNFQRNSAQTMNLRSSTSTSAMEIENTREILEDQITSSIDSIEEALSDVQKSLGRR